MKERAQTKIGRHVFGQWSMRELLSGRWRVFTPAFDQVTVEETLTKKQARAVLRAMEEVYWLGQQDKAKEIREALSWRAR